MSYSNQKGILLCLKKYAFTMKMVFATCLIILVTGCLSESDTGGVFNRVKDPVGTVSGLVQDTNGNALEGAIVSIAGQTQETDAHGRYTFNNFPVSNVEGNDNDNDTNEAGPRINIYVAPPQNGPTAYLSATISFGPTQAEIDGTNVDGNGQIDTSANTIENGAVTFIDGFVIEAPVAQLPALDNTVTGFLVDNTTGLPIVDKLVYLNISNPDTLGSNGFANNVTLQDVNISANAVTTESGEFKVEKVPNDSALDLIVAGYTFEMVSANGSGFSDITTRIEDNVYLGNVYMSPVVVGDDRPPVITDVIIHPTVDVDSIEGRTVARTIHIKLSEDITTTPTINSVFVNYEDADTGQDIFLELASEPTVDGNAITIVTVEDMTRLNIAANGTLTVSFARADFADAAGNGIVENADDQGASSWLNLSVETFALQAIATDANPPFILSVDGVRGQITDPSVVATLVMRFNKPLQPISENLVNSAVFVTIGAEERAGTNEFIAYNDINLTLDEAGLTLTIEMVGSELPQNADVKVDLLQNAFIDEDGQVLVINNNAVNFVNTDDRGFVSVEFDTIQGRQAASLSLNVLDENDEASNPYPNHAALVSVSDTAISQLNNQDNDDSANGSDTVQRLTALMNAINDVDNSQVNVDRTLLSFPLVANAASYEMTAQDSLGLAKNINIEDLQGLSISAFNFPVTVFVADGTGQNPRISLSGVSPGDTISVIPVDSYGVRTLDAEFDTVTLEDKIPPATVLQNAYSVGNDVVAESTSFGSGAELSQEGGSNANFGVPFFDITPALLGVVEGALNTREISDLTRNSAKNNDLSNEDVGNLLYDEASYNAWDPVRTMGIAMSEDVSLVPGKNFNEVISGVSDSEWDIVNDITIDDDGAPNSADLTIFSTDVIELSINQHNQIVKFAGILQDSNGNIMPDDNGSRVIMRDRIPPMATSAVYAYSSADRTTSLTINFNEPIHPESFVNISIGDVILPDFNYEGFDMPDNKTVVLTFTTLDGNFDPIDSNLNIAIDRSIAFNRVEETFGVLDTSVVEDLHGNSWDDYERGENNFDSSNPNNDPLPSLAAENTTDPFGFEVTSSGFTEDRSACDSFWVEYKFSQPITADILASVTGGNDIDNDGIDDSLNLNVDDIFNLEGTNGISIKNDESLITLDSNSTLRVNIRLHEGDPEIDCDNVDATQLTRDLTINGSLSVNENFVGNFVSRIDPSDVITSEETNVQVSQIQ